MAHSPYVELELKLRADEDDAGTQPLIRRLHDWTKVQLSNTVALQQSYILANAASNSVLSMGEVVTGHVLMLESDQDISIRLAPAGTELLLNTRIGSNRAMFFHTGQFTFLSASMTHPSATEATLTYAILGAY